MINLTRGERELDLERRTQAFIRDEVIPYEKDPRILHHGPSDDLRLELQAKAKAAGLLSPHVGVAYGGLGLHHREIATVFRAAGYSLLGPVSLNCMAPDEGNMCLLEKVGDAAQKEQFLRPLASGATRSAFFMTEPDDGAGSDPSMMKTTARQHGNHWVISGRKWLITGADGAACGIIMAKTEQGATLFLTDMKDPAIVTERVLDTIDRTMPGGHAVMRLDDLRVSSDQILGEVGQGFKYAQVRLAPARLTHCMRWWGAAKRAHDIALNYACRRNAFGKPLIDLSFYQQRYEADFRFSMARIRENGEQIAMMRGGAAEQASLMSRYEWVLSNAIAKIKRQKLLTWVTAGFGQGCVANARIAAGCRVVDVEFRLAVSQQNHGNPM